ncbi:unnamed protein product [Dovyalis caffra]|uniref:Secreted protein n=1 Tax=Dovyalis caffra TaxID=77055 RepID=A0AAV1SJR7_9ROSI|nr:unnamed protein product [Dovyalis caffra]
MNCCSITVPCLTAGSSLARLVHLYSPRTVRKMPIICGVLPPANDASPSNHFSMCKASSSLAVTLLTRSCPVQLRLSMFKV